VDWITLTPHEIDNDALTPVCAHCGGRATSRHNQDYEWHPEWVGWLYLAGFVPGLIAQAICHKKKRVALPVCPRHGPMTPWQIAGASVGWLLLPALLGGATLGACLLLRQRDPEASPSNALLITVTSVSAGLGLLLWLAWLIRVRTGYRTITVRSIDADGVTLVGLAEPFVKAMKEQRLANANAATYPPVIGNTGIVTYRES
jgi:hypothetical protein